MKHFGTNSQEVHPAEKLLVVVWDKEGYNQWGTKYVYRCRCGNDTPCNLYGMGTCLRCGISRNPTRKSGDEYYSN